MIPPVDMPMWMGKSHKTLASNPDEELTQAINDSLERESVFPAMSPPLIDYLTVISKNIHISNSKWTQVILI